MEDKKHVKVQGIRFARSLQMLVKMANMFSADHKSVTGLLQRSYDLLNPLVKQSRHLTLGFVDQRVLLNNILTAEDSLKPLENEFLKRGIGAVTFEAGITLAAYRSAVGALSASFRLIEESGGVVARAGQVMAKALQRAQAVALLRFQMVMVAVVRFAAEIALVGLIGARGGFENRRALPIDPVRENFVGLFHFHVQAPE